MMTLPSTIISCFEAVVKQYPNSCAMIYQEKEIDYMTLNQQVNQLAHYLQKIYFQTFNTSLKPNTLIGIKLPRGEFLIVAILAVMKIGCAYVPLDPDYPEERLLAILKHCDLSMCIVGYQRIKQYTGLQIDLESSRLDIEGQSLENLDYPILPSSLAYVIYTSGTTGIPKGVMIKHESVCNMIHWVIQYYPILPSDKVLQIASFMFDLSVWEIASALLSGACLVLTEPILYKDPNYLFNLMQKHQVSVLGAVPSLLNLIFMHPKIGLLSHLKHVLSCAEPLTYPLCKLIHQNLSVRLYNGYGPTETTIMCMHWLCPPNLPSTASILIGKPIKNTEILVLDEHQNRVPVGEIGELYVGGMGVCVGYLNDVSQNEKCFITIPVKNDSGARFYKTGDRVRVVEADQLEFVGRSDYQVKLRGYRIELEDIAKNILHYPGIEQCLVIVKRLNNLDYLVSYITVIQNYHFDMQDLRRQLKHCLPDYMIPTYFIKLDSFPLSENGKIDRASLPQPSIDSRWGRL